MNSHKLKPEELLKFILGGKATFTIKNTTNGNRFTYKVTIPKDTTPELAGIYFVKLMCGPDNESMYKYIGYIRKNTFATQFVYGHKSKISKDAPGVVAFEFVFNKIVAPHRTSNTLEIWHEGKCGRCGRKLTVPESIESGFGPECIKIIIAA